MELSIKTSITLTMELSNPYPDTWRNSTQYIVTGTDSFRLASRMLTTEITRPSRDGQVGSNLQNIEKWMRRIYWADEGKRLLQRDQRGAEALVVAYLCRHGNFRDLFLNGIKSHSYVGLHLFAKEWQKEVDKGYGGKDIKCNISELTGTSIGNLRANPFWPEVASLIQSSDNWPSAKRFYYIAKQVCHSSNYGVGPKRFVLNTLEKSKGKIVLSKRDAEHYLEFYHGMFPEIREWHREVLEQVEKTNYLYNLFGFPRYFYHKGIIHPSKFKEYYAFIAQSTVGTITNIAYTRMQAFIEETEVEWDMLANTHDSYLVQCPDSDTEVAECDRVMKNFIEIELTSPRGEKFKMQSDGATGLNWGPYYANKNPHGLREIK